MQWELRQAEQLHPRHDRGGDDGDALQGLRPPHLRLEERRREQHPKTNVQLYDRSFNFSLPVFTLHLPCDKPHPFLNTESIASTCDPRYERRAHSAPDDARAAQRPR